MHKSVYVDVLFYDDKVRPVREDKVEEAKIDIENIRNWMNRMNDYSKHIDLEEYDLIDIGMLLKDIKYHSIFFVDNYYELYYDMVMKKIDRLKPKMTEYFKEKYNCDCTPDEIYIGKYDSSQFADKDCRYKVIIGNTEFNCNYNVMTPTAIHAHERTTGKLEVVVGDMTFYSDNMLSSGNLRVVTEDLTVNSSSHVVSFDNVEYVGKRLCIGEASSKLMESVAKSNMKVGEVIEFYQNPITVDECREIFDKKDEWENNLKKYIKLIDEGRSEEIDIESLIEDIVNIKLYVHEIKNENNEYYNELLSKIDVLRNRIASYYNVNSKDVYIGDYVLGVTERDSCSYKVIVGNMKAGWLKNAESVGDVEIVAGDLFLWCPEACIFSLGNLNKNSIKGKIVYNNDVVTFDKFYENMNDNIEWNNRLARYLELIDKGELDSIDIKRFIEDIIPDTYDSKKERCSNYNKVIEKLSIVIPKIAEYFDCNVNEIYFGCYENDEETVFCRSKVIIGDVRLYRSNLKIFDCEHVVGNFEVEDCDNLDSINLTDDNIWGKVNIRSNHHMFRSLDEFKANSLIKKKEKKKV